MMNLPITAGHAIPPFAVGQTVLVALLRKVGDTVICNPAQKTISAVGERSLSFKDGKSQLMHRCYLNNPQGMKDCLAWCEYVKSFQEAFNWSIRTAPS